MEADGFDWDEGNTEKCQKHRVSVDEIESLFQAGPLVRPDRKHSTIEARFYAIGRTMAGRAMIVTFTWREVAGERLIRPISALYMHQKEVEAYEKAVPTAEQ